jgi:hypothetical protein
MPNHYTQLQTEERALIQTMLEQVAHAQWAGHRWLAAIAA